MYIPYTRARVPGMEPESSSIKGGKLYLPLSRDQKYRGLDVRVKRKGLKGIEGEERRK